MFQTYQAFLFLTTVLGDGVLPPHVVAPLPPQVAAATPQVVPPRRAVTPFEEARSRSLREGKPVVVFAGQPARDVKGCITLRDDRPDVKPGVWKTSVLIGVPNAERDGVRWFNVEWTPDDAAIRAEIARMYREVYQGPDNAPIRAQEGRSAYYLAPALFRPQIAPYAILGASVGNCST
jgi:hypothetical protein